MAFCRNCGTQLDDDALFCQSCGADRESGIPSVADNGGFLWGLFGFFIPVAGFVLYLAWRDERPKTTRALGIGTIIGGIIWGICYVISMLTLFVLAVI